MCVTVNEIKSACEIVNEREREREREKIVKRKRERFVSANRRQKRCERFHYLFSFLLNHVKQEFLHSG